MSLKDSFLYTDLCNRLAVWPAITPEQLLIELERVDRPHLNQDLGSSFLWASSPQGHDFWNDLSNKAYPPEYF